MVWNAGGGGGTLAPGSGWQRTYRQECERSSSPGMCWGWGVGALSKSLVENRREGQMFLYYFLGLEERLFRDAVMMIVGASQSLPSARVFHYT